MKMTYMSTINYQKNGNENVQLAYLKIARPDTTQSFHNIKKICFIQNMNGKEFLLRISNEKNDVYGEKKTCLKFKASNSRWMAIDIRKKIT